MLSLKTRFRGLVSIIMALARDPQDPRVTYSYCQRNLNNSYNSKLQYIIVK